MVDKEPKKASREASDENTAAQNRHERETPESRLGRPEHFPQKVGERVVKVAYQVIWPWVIMLLLGALLVLLYELLQSLSVH